MSKEQKVMSEVKALIRFYERRGWNWRLAAAFHLLHSTFEE